jgi:hypothetical protein
MLKIHERNRKNYCKILKCAKNLKILIFGASKSNYLELVKNMLKILNAKNSK